MDVIGKLSEWALFTYKKLFKDYFLGRLKYGKLGKSMCLTIWIQVLKVVEVIT